MPARNGAFTNERTSRLSHNANRLFISHNIIRARGADASSRRDVAPPPYIVHNPSEVGAGFMPARNGAFTNERTSRLSHLRHPFIDVLRQPFCCYNVVTAVAGWHKTSPYSSRVWYKNVMLVGSAFLFIGIILNFCKDMEFARTVCSRK